MKGRKEKGGSVTWAKTDACPSSPTPPHSLSASTSSSLRPTFLLPHACAHYQGGAHMSHHTTSCGQLVGDRSYATAGGPAPITFCLTLLPLPGGSLSLVVFLTDSFPHPPLIFPGIMVTDRDLRQRIDFVPNL